MGGNGSANARSIALDKVEHSGRHACRIKNFCKDRSVTGAFLGRLQDHRIATSQRRSHLQRNLVERPVPRRDHADDADRLINDQIRAMAFAELEGFERFNGPQEAADPGPNLGSCSKVERSAHLIRHRLRKVADTLLVFFHDAAKQREPFLAAGLAIGFECCSCSFHGCIDIRLGSERYFSAGFFGRRADDQMALAAD